MGFGESTRRLPIRWLWCRLSSYGFHHLHRRRRSRAKKILAQFEEFLARNETVFEAARPMPSDEAVTTVEWLKSDVEVARLLLSRMERALKAQGNTLSTEFCGLAIRLALAVADNEMDKGESYRRLWDDAEQTLIEWSGGTPCLPRVSNGSIDL
jgi:hypothetical protein